jgi:mitogen-activated protein kinase kinase kinase
MAASVIHSSSSGNNGTGLSSWTSLGSMNMSSTAGTGSPRSIRSNSLTNSSVNLSFAAGGQPRQSMLSTPAAGVPQPTEEELAGRTYLEWIRSWNDDLVATWLTDNRCAAHAMTFAKNDIRGDVILDVDQQALKEMGVQSVSCGSHLQKEAQRNLFICPSS